MSDNRQTVGEAGAQVARYEGSKYQFIIEWIPMHLIKAILKCSYFIFLFVLALSSFLFAFSFHEKLVYGIDF